MSGELIEKKPSYLSETSVEVDNSDINAYVKPSRIKLIQAMTGSPLKPPFSEGDAVVIPQGIKIGDRETEFTFVPIHFFPTWICLNPLQMRGTLPTIREFTFDPESETAKIAKSFAKVKCPENPEHYLKYSETLNFMVVLPDVPELEAMPPIHIFFSRGEYGTGQRLLGDIQLRKAPRYACRFRAVTNTHTNKQGQSWVGLEFRNDPQPWVDEENFHRYEEMYKELKKLIDARTMELDMSDASEPATEGSEF